MSQKTVISTTSRQERWQEKESYSETNQSQPQANQSQPSNDLAIGFIIGFFRFFLEGIATAFEVPLRKNFGERYFTPLKFLFGLVIILFFLFASLFSGFFEGIESTTSTLQSTSTSQSSPTNLFQRPYTEEQLEERQETSSFGFTSFDMPEAPRFGLVVFLVYLIVYIALGLGELRKQFERHKDGKAWHSYHVGESRLKLFQIITEGLKLKSVLGNHLIANHIVQLYIEPLFFFSLGLGIVFFIPEFGAFLVFGSSMVFIRGQMIYNRIRNQLLDIKDNKIESKFMAEAIKGVDPKNTAGFSTMSIRPQTTSNAVATSQALTNTFKNNPELAKLAGVDIEKSFEAVKAKKVKVNQTETN